MSQVAVVSDHHIDIAVPADCYTPDRTFGGSRAELQIHAPFDMTPERFREIVKAKGGMIGVACWQLSPKYGPVLSGTWVESGVKVYFTGVVEEQS